MGLVFTHSLRSRSRPTGSGYGGVRLVPYLLPRAFEMRGSPLSPRLEAAEPRPPERRASCAAVRAAAAPTRVPRRGPLTAPRGAAAGLTPRTHRPARGASANHTPLAGIHQTASRKEEEKSQTHKTMLGLAFHPPHPLLL